MAWKSKLTIDALGTGEEIRLVTISLSISQELQWNDLQTHRTWTAEGTVLQPQSVETNGGTSLSIHSQETCFPAVLEWELGFAAWAEQLICQSHNFPVSALKTLVRMNRAFRSYQLIICSSIAGEGGDEVSSFLIWQNKLIKNWTNLIKF